MVQAGAPQMDSERAHSARTMAIIAYILFLVGWPTLHLTTIAAVILSYIQRDEVRGSLWETHFTNVIHTFWISLIVGIAAAPLCFVLIGFPIEAGVVIWFLYRTIKGLVRAIDGMPYL